MRFWIVLLMIALALLPFVAQMPGYSPFWRAMNNSSHTALFLVLTLAAAGLLRLPVALAARAMIYWGLLCGGLLGLGLAIELVQPLFGRQRSLEDLYLDGLGVAAGVCLYWAYRLRAWRWPLLVGALGFVGLAALKPVKMLKWQWNLYRQLPLVCNLDQPCPGFGGVSGGHVERESNGESTQWPGNDSEYAVVRFPKEPYPGLGMGTISTDWRSYSAICADIYWPGNESRIGVHIRDMRFPEEAIKFDRLYPVQPGENTLCVALEEVARFVHLHKAKTLIYYTPAPQEAGEFYLDNVRLKP